MARDLLQALLEDNWTPSVSGRVQDVPEPLIVEAGSIKRSPLEDTDVIYVKDGGITSKEPAGLGWQEERQTDYVTLDIRTIDARGGRDRLDGVRDPDTYEKEDYGGLTGEVERILDEHRVGTAEYQLVVGYEKNDISEQQGFGRYRMEFEVRCHTGPVNVDPPSSG